MDLDLIPVIMPAVEILFIVLGVVLSALGGWAIKKFGDKLGVEQSAKMFEYVDLMIAKGLALMKKKTMTELEDADITVSIKNLKVAFVADYVIKQAPKYLSKLKIDETKLAALIESKL